MSRQEKGELLLAQHEGKIIQTNIFGDESTWITFLDGHFTDCNAYRVKPEPKVREVELYFGKLEEGALVQRYRSDTHKLRIKLADGIPPVGYFSNSHGDLIVIESIRAPF